MNNLIEKIKKYDIYLIFCGGMAVIGGLVMDNTMPWLDEINLSSLKTCIANIHFRNHTEPQFIQCVSPQLEKIENRQHLNILTGILYAIGGIFIGLGFQKKEKKHDL